MSRVEITVAHHHGYGYDCRTLVNPKPQSPPVVLVGGAFQQKTAWGRLETLLAEAASVVTVDLPGWGESDLLPARYGMDFLAEALHRVLLQAGHRRVHVFGGSYGGALAFRLAQQHPEQVLSLALMGTPARIAEPVRAQLLRTIALLRADRIEEFADYAVSVILSKDPAARIARGPAVRRVLTAIFGGIGPEDGAKFVENTLRLLEHDLHAVLPPVGVPVLLGTGEHDDFTGPEYCRAVADYCADARFALLRDADHAVHLQVPDALADLLLRFFAGRSLDGLPYCHPVEYYAGGPAGATPGPTQPAGALG
jgi:pimeloyl-ACP methyl ester carboxylesterase